MASRHHDVEYIPLDSGPGEAAPTRRPVASAKYAGHLFLAAALFAAVLVGGTFGRWVTSPNVIITQVPSTVKPVHYDPVVTLLDSFIDMCVTKSFCPVRSADACIEIPVPPLNTRIRPRRNTTNERSSLLSIPMDTPLPSPPLAIHSQKSTPTREKS